MTHLTDEEVLELAELAGKAARAIREAQQLSWPPYRLIGCAEDMATAIPKLLSAHSDHLARIGDLEKELRKVVEAATDLDDAAVNLLDLNVAGYYIDNPEHCPSGRIDIALEHLAELRERSRIVRASFQRMVG